MKRWDFFFSLPNMRKMRPTAGSGHKLVSECNDGMVGDS